MPETFNPPHPVLPPTRVGSKELSIIVRTDGMMASQYDECVCGAKKREWHPICLREKQNG